MTRLEYNGDVFEKIPTDQPGYYNWIGKKSHWLVVIDAYFRVTEGKPKQRYFLCRCKCGKEKLVHGDGIRKQRIKSCGCWKPIVDAQKAKEMGDSNLKHGLSGTRIYKTWEMMIRRCDEPDDKAYKNYGARGISYDPRWRDFSSFYEDMKEDYEENLTIDRIDVYGNYTKDNCRWITMDDQQCNKRNTVYIEHDGKKHTLKEWSEITGITVSALRQRHKAGMSPEEILKPDIRTKITLTLNGEEHSIKEWAKKLGMTEKVIRSRYECGWDDERILSTPVRSIKGRK